MTNKTKHIPATPDLLRIGQVVEVYHCSWQIDGKGCEWRIHDTDSAKDLFNIQKHFYWNQIRIPLITHEDILNCAWFGMDRVSPSHDVYWYGHRDGWNLEFTEFQTEMNILIECPEGEIMRFTIQTLLDLKDLMRLLGIQ